MFGRVRAAIIPPIFLNSSCNYIVIIRSTGCFDLRALELGVQSTGALLRVLELSMGSNSMPNTKNRSQVCRSIPFCGINDRKREIRV
ncbi:hypothetical protein ACET3Z_011647 [Daucus carota]